MKRLSIPRRIGILGHVGRQNLGDEAIIAAVVQNVRSRLPAAELTAFTLRPDDTRVRHGIPAYPIRPLRNVSVVGVPAVGQMAMELAPTLAKSPTTLSGAIRERLRHIAPLYALLRRVAAVARGVAVALAETRLLVGSLRRLRRTDLLIVAGSNQLSDYFGGPWNFPYTLLTWSLLARLAGVRVAYASVGVGPVRSPLSRFLLRRAARLAAYRSYRDVGSLEAAARIGLKGEQVIAPDLAHSLHFVRPHREPPPPSAPLVVGINPMPYFDERYWPESDARVYASYIDALAEFAVWLRRRNYEVRFFPTQLRADPPIIEDIRDRMRTSAAGLVGPVPANPMVGSFEDLVALLAEVDLVVATRFHGIVLAHLMGKPTIGIAYRRSTRDLLKDLGLAEFVLDVSEITPQGLAARLKMLEAQRAEIAGHISHRLDAYRETLARQYDTLLGVGEAGGGALRDTAGRRRGRSRAA
jgi:polysaccharide pyruvyl transferase WcaK-like protein